MHIVFLSRRAWPAVGGVERHIFFLCQALLKNSSDIKISVITECSDPSWKAQEIHDGVTYYRFSLLPNAANPNVKLSVFKGMQLLLPILKTADVIHVHDVFFWLFPIFPQIFHKKIFMTFHGYEVPGPPNWKQRFWHQLAEVLSDGNICVGDFHQKWYGVNPTVVSFGAVEGLVSKIEKSVSTKTKTKLLFVGRLENDTGIWAYLEALAIAKQKHDCEFELTVIGDGPLRTSLEFFVQDTHLPVKFLGQQKLTPKTYENFDASLGTGYLSILESLVAGVPVIATYVTELKKDYLEKTPFAKWIDISTPGEKLAAELIKPHTLSPKAQVWAASQTWGYLAEQYIQLWKNNG